MIPRPNKHPRTSAACLRVRGLVGKAIADFRMIGEGDRVMVCLFRRARIPYTLLDMLLSLQRAARFLRALRRRPRPEAAGFPFECAARILPRIARRAVPRHEHDTYSVVRRVIPEGRTQCGLCSRPCGAARFIASRASADSRALRSAIIGDDIVETLFLNLFHGGRLKAIRQSSIDDGANVVVPPALLSFPSGWPLRCAARVPDHPLYALRIAAQPAA